MIKKNMIKKIHKNLIKKNPWSFGQIWSKIDHEEIKNFMSCVK